MGAPRRPGDGDAEACGVLGDGELQTAGAWASGLGGIGHQRGPPASMDFVRNERTLHETPHSAPDVTQKLVGC